MTTLGADQRGNRTIVMRKVMCAPQQKKIQAGNQQDGSGQSCKLPYGIFPKANVFPNGTGLLIVLFSPE
jgi:hypothetical protein